MCVLLPPVPTLGHVFVLLQRDSRDTICPSTGLLQFSFVFKFNKFSLHYIAELYFNLHTHRDNTVNKIVSRQCSISFGKHLKANKI